MSNIWQDRFTKRTYETAGYLVERYNLYNWRIHPEQQRAITEGSLDKLGWIGEVKIAEGPDKLFDGHLRVKIALLRGGPDTLVPVNWYNLNEEETNQALLIHDSTTLMASTDWEAFTNLVDIAPALEIPEFDDWLSKMLEQSANGLLATDPANDPYAEWAGMPEYENEEAFGAIATLKVHFASEEDVAKFAQVVGQTVTKDTTYIWFPKQERENLKVYRVRDES